MQIGLSFGVRKSPARALSSESRGARNMANVQDSSNDGSSDDDDDDEDEEEDPMEESLVNLVGNTIKELAPAAQVLCRKQIILAKLGRMGIFRVVDLQQIMDADIQMVVAALSPTPLLFAFKLKQAVTALLAGAERQSTLSRQSFEYLTKRHQGLSTALNAIGCSTLFLHTSDLLLTGTHL